MLIPSIFAFRMRRMPSSSFRKNAIKRQVPYWLFIKKYWPRLLGSTGSFFVSVSLPFAKVAHGPLMTSNSLATQGAPSRASSSAA